MTPQDFNDWKLVSLSPLPLWALVLLALALLVGAGMALWGVRKEPVRRRRWTLWALRGLAALAALFLLLEPGVRDLQVARAKSRVAVLVDRSGSMDFPVEAGGPTRSKAVAEALAQLAPAMDAKADRFVFETYGFDPELSPVTPETLETEPARAGRTDLLSALRAAKAGGGGRKLSGVLLFSDGADNTELATGVVGGARAAVADLEVPVNTVLVGQSALLDLAIERVQVDDFAFVRNSLTVEVEVRGRGFEGRTVPLTLSREGQPVATKNVTLRGEEPVTVAFTFTPDQTGRFVYTVEAPVFPREAVVENNSRAFTLKVIRDRVRVLLVVGRPSWDERFLRGLLKQDANVDLVSFYILRTMADEPNVTNPLRELSLIPFPMDEIFRQKLSTFDVVILQNFGYSNLDLSIAGYEPDLVDYVKEGGSLVFIGGDAVLGAGEGNFPRLQEVLPLEGAGPPDVQPFVARLSAEGARHPITAVATGGASSEAVWAGLPPIPGLNVTRAKPNATVLLEHPGAKRDGKPLPLAAVWDAGRGRVMALATDGSWAWAFTANREGSPNRAYDRFWGNALRWLVRDPDLTTLNVLADPPSVEPGRSVGAVVTVRDATYQPAAGAQVTVELVDVSTQQRLGAQAGTTGPDGEVRVEFPPPDPGAYKLRASAQRDGKSLGEGEDAVAVRAVGPELADASVRPELLQQLAELTKGRFQTLEKGVTLEIPLLEPPVVEVGRSKDRPMWDQPWALLLLVALLGTEWFLRRRFGYV